MTDTRYQNRGVGSGIISDVILCLKSSGYKEIRLGVDKGNPQSVLDKKQIHSNP